MRLTKLIPLLLAVWCALILAACLPEKEEEVQVPSAQGQVDKARAAADAANRAATRTDHLSAQADGSEDETEDDDGEEP